MRVTHVITRLITGGAQENTIATVLGLNRFPGVTADLISGPTTGREGSLEHLLRSQPGTHWLLPQLVRQPSPKNDWIALRRMVQWFTADRPDIVHTHSGKAGILGRLAARIAKVPLIIHTIHGPSFGSFQGVVANEIFTYAELVAGRATDHFISVADAMSRQYLAAGIGEPSQYTTIYSGFDLEPFLRVQRDDVMRAKLGIRPGDFVIGKIARLFELKGHDDLLDAAPDILRRVPNARFLFVGDGPWWDQLREKASAFGDRVIFTGLVTPEAVPGCLGAMDALAHLSRREGLPRAVSQAAAAGLPVVAYDCDGAGEVCQECKTGFLVEPGNLAALSSRLWVLASQPELAAEYGTAGREFVRAQFGADRMVSRIHDLYQRLLEAKAHGLSL